MLLSCGIDGDDSTSSAGPVTFHQAGRAGNPQRVVRKKWHASNGLPPAADPVRRNPPPWQCGIRHLGNQKCQMMSEARIAV